MISVFVYKDEEDHKCWKWQAGPERENTLEEEPTHYEERRICFDAYVRETPMPSIVLPLVDKAVDPFKKAVKVDPARTEDVVAAMEKFIVALRQYIGITELQSMANDPLCVFIHFGDGNASTFNDRLRCAWEKLGDEKERFLCFAISRNEASINDPWKNGNILALPDAFKNGLDTVIKNGWKEYWKGETKPPVLPQAFSVNGGDGTRVNNGSMENGNSKISSEGQVSQGGKPSENPSAQKGNDPTGKNKEAGDGKGPKKSFFGLVLKLLVSLELIGWSGISLWKYWQADSLKEELLLGALGIALLIVPVSMVLALHEDDSSSS